jgi:hypothetical protein
MKSGTVGDYFCTLHFIINNPISLLPKFLLYLPARKKLP